MSTLPHRCLSSTTYAVEEVKIRRPVRAKVTGRRGPEGDQSAASGPAGPSKRARALRAWRFAPRLDWRKPITVQLRYIHTADPCIEVRARGHVQRYPWDMAILDILSDICNR